MPVVHPPKPVPAREKRFHELGSRLKHRIKIVMKTPEKKLLCQESHIMLSKKQKATHIPLRQTTLRLSSAVKVFFSLSGAATTP
jgi:hypothetical protein